MEQLLIKACEALNLSINEKQVEQFIKYKDLLIEWNKKINLTAITDEKEIVLKHFIDCISLMSVYKIEDNMNIIDVGTGAGFPAVPIKIMCPDVNVTLLDSLNKRINFLNELIIQLELKNIFCIHSRAEDSGRDKKFREKYDLCVSRAVANLAVLSEYCLPFILVGGTFISFKSVNIDDELNEAKTAIKKLGAKIDSVKTVNIPYSDIQRSIVIIKKIRQTPSQYPRKAGMVSKQPIK